MRLSLSLAVVTMLGSLGLLAATQQDLNGAWSLSFNTPNGVIDASATFKVDGEKVTGTISGQAGEVPFTGTLTGKSFTVTFDVQTPNGNLSVSMNGEQDGDTMKGTFDFGQGTGDWTGKRK